MPYALLLHGTSRADKEWQNGEWVKVGQWLSREGLEVLLPWGNDRELERCRYLSGMIPHPRILERMQLDAIARVIGYKASFVFCVDTGPLQLAAACEIPLAAIFVSTRIDLTGPIGNGPIVIFGGEGKPVSAEEVILSLEQKSMLSPP